jgi:hypothetical protein
VLGDVLPARQVPEARPGDLGIEGEVEVPQIARILEARLTDAPGDRFAVPPHRLVL